MLAEGYGKPTGENEQLPLCLFKKEKACLQNIHQCSVASPAGNQPSVYRVSSPITSTRWQHVYPVTVKKKMNIEPAVQRNDWLEQYSVWNAEIEIKELDLR